MNFTYKFEKKSGVSVEYWEIAEIKINAMDGSAEAKLLGYVNAEFKNAGKPYEIEHHVYFTANKDDSKFIDLVGALSSVIQNKFTEVAIASAKEG